MRLSWNSKPLFVAPVDGFFNDQQINIAVACHLANGSRAKQDYAFRGNNADDAPYNLVYERLIDS